MVKRTLPVLVTFVSGMIVIASFFCGDGLPWLKNLDKRVPEWFQIIAVFTLLIGILNLLKHNLDKVNRRIDGWGYNLVLLCGFVVMFGLGMARGTTSEVVAGKRFWHPSLALEITVVSVKTDPVKPWVRTAEFQDEAGARGEVAVEVLRSPTLAIVDAWYKLFFEGVLKAANATILSLLAFFVASASFRAFRVKSWEAGVMLVSALIVMLGNVPIGGLFPLDLQGLKEWILKVPSSAAQSAILIGAVLGYVGAALKILLGIERSHLGGPR